MKFTSEDLMKAMGLSVGDRIKYNDQIWIIEKSEECQGAWIGFTDGNRWFNIDSLINATDYEILPRPKRVGNLTCDDIPHSDCTTCPIKILCLDYGDTNNQSFYEILKDYKSKSGEHFDQEIHDLLKARLDKEVK